MHGQWQIRRYIHDLLYFKRPDNILSLDQCVTCLKSSESTNHLCLHCPPTLELWHRLFCIGNVKCVSTRGIVEMLGISFKGFSSLSKGKTLTYQKKSQKGRHYGKWLSCYPLYGFYVWKGMLGYLRID